MSETPQKPNDYVKQVIVIRRQFLDKNNKPMKLRTGKMIAQACHASMAFLSETVQRGLSLNVEQTKWINGRFAKICVYVETEEDLDRIYKEAKEAGLMVKLITDAGNTEFHGVPTKTCLAIGPNYASEIDKITGTLPLL
jgi:PTH2 family peptidyl-tRNA hydrolase